MKELIETGKLLFRLVLLLVLAAALYVLTVSFTALERGPAKVDAIATSPQINGSNQNNLMKISSPAFSHQGEIPPQFTCDGADANPALDISGVPSGAKSLVLIVDDPDAPLGTWTHWVVWNIDPAVSFVGENSVPAGAVEGQTSFGKPGYGGPCPPSGAHRYFFRLYALDKLLDLPPASARALVESEMKGHVLAEAELMGSYSRR